MTNETEQNEAEIKPRTCANCACSIIQKNQLTGMDTQMFCRRNTINSHMARLERPRINPKTGQIDLDRHSQKPIMESYNDLIYLFTPTIATAVCFDGWRPLGTEPGDFSYKSADLEKMYSDAMARLATDMQLQREGVLPDAFPIDDEGKKN